MAADHARALRDTLASGEVFIAPGCYDALTALLVERAGFDCAYLSGASVAFTRLGRPDLGLTTLTEVADTVACIRDRVSIPLIVDGDNATVDVGGGGFTFNPSTGDDSLCLHISYPPTPTEPSSWGRIKSLY